MEILSSVQDLLLIAGWPVAGAAALAALYTRRSPRSAPPSRAESTASGRLESLASGHSESPAPSYETRYRDVIASIDGIVWESDAATHRTLFISDAVERVLGYSPAQWVSDEGLWRRIMYPEDIGAVVGALQSLVDRSADDISDSTEVVYRMFAADGRTVWLQTTIRVIRENGRAILYRGVSLDITQRKLHDLRVAESERFIKTIADNLPALVTYWTRDHRCAFANRSVWDWFDRDPAKLIGIHMRDHLGPDLYEKDLPHVEAVLAGKPQQFERTLTRADGRIIQVVAQYVPDVIDGEVAGYFALVSDITTVKARETQLRLLEKSVAQLNDVVMVLVTAPQRPDDLPTGDLPEGAAEDAVPYAEPRIVYVNDAVERQTGYRVDEVIGATPPFLRDVITPGAETAMLITALRGGKPARAELTCRRKNGHDVNLEIDITPISDESGRVTHTIVIERDITERKQQERENLEAVRRLSESEAFANLVLQSIDAVIIVSDRESNVLRVNRKAELISGYSEADLRNSALAASLVPPDEYAGVKQVLDQTDPALFPITHVNHWIARTGERHLLRWSNVALTDETGEIALRIGIGVDITELRRHEQALIAAKNQAETANRAKSSFLATMSHELRTPLNAIIGFSDLMARQSFGPIGNAKYLDYVNDVLNSGNQLLSIINDILDLSRVEAGKQELKPESLSLADIWPPIANGLSAAASRKNIRITTPADLQEVSFLADRRAVMQIVTNLVNNSTKFTATGGEIHLHARHSANGAETVISVRDNGRGIPRERIQDVLKPFVQVANTYSRDEGGTGLGLAICNALAGSMQGRIAIDSELGAGTTVFLFLPAPALIDAPKSVGRAVEAKIGLD